MGLSINGTASKIVSRQGVNWDLRYHSGCETGGSLRGPWSASRFLYRICMIGEDGMTIDDGDYFDS
jgi:hypothetical protein